MNNPTPSGNTKTWIARLDQWIFVKKCYSLWMHLVPFAVAGLLLVVLSVPAENLLRRLVLVLGNPSWIWLPAALLTIVTTGLYFVSLRTQIKRAYLLPAHLFRRTLLTGTLFLILCIVMAYGVLITTPPPRHIGPDLWACWMVAALSLTGIGWKGPEAWIEAIHLQMPDYDECHTYTTQVTRSLQRLRRPQELNLETFQQFTDQLSSLRKGIESNLPLEPDWQRPDVDSPASVLRRLETQVKEDIGEKPDSTHLQIFADVCRGRRKTEYPNLVETIAATTSYWPDWYASER